MGVTQSLPKIRSSSKSNHCNQVKLVQIPLFLFVSVSLSIYFCLSFHLFSHKLSRTLTNFHIDVDTKKVVSNSTLLLDVIRYDLHQKKGTKPEKMCYWPFCDTGSSQCTCPFKRFFHFFLQHFFLSDFFSPSNPLCREFFCVRVVGLSKFAYDSLPIFHTLLLLSLQQTIL